MCALSKRLAGAEKVVRLEEGSVEDALLFYNPVFPATIF
jgi:hypothetical protein